MLLINCPHCGPRDEIEFRCGGESHIPRPAIECSDDVWADYLFARTNVKGLTVERWRHSYGCGCWVNIARDTRSHAIRAVYAMNDRRPSLAGSADG